MRRRRIRLFSAHAPISGRAASSEAPRRPAALALHLRPKYPAQLRTARPWRRQQRAFAAKDEGAGAELPTRTAVWPAPSPAAERKLQRALRRPRAPPQTRKLANGPFPDRRPANILADWLAFHFCKEALRETSNSFESLHGQFGTTLCAASHALRQPTNSVAKSKDERLCSPDFVAKATEANCAQEGSGAELSRSLS